MKLSTIVNMCLASAGGSLIGPALATGNYFPIVTGAFLMLAGIFFGTWAADR
jgi:hypothetical protein